MTVTDPVAEIDLETAVGTMIAIIADVAVIGITDLGGMLHAIVSAADQMILLIWSTSLDGMTAVTAVSIVVLDLEHKRYVLPF